MRTKSIELEGFAAFAFICFFAACAGAWATHVVWTIRTLAGDAGVTVGQAVLGVIGAFMPPVGVVHGFILWFS